MRPYWTFRDECAMIDGVAMKSKRVIIPEGLQQQTIEQLHMTHMDTEKTRLLATASVHYINMNSNTENAIKVQYSLDFSCYSLQIIKHKLPGEPWEVIGPDVFQINDRNFLCIVDYFSKVWMVNQAEKLFVDSLIAGCKSVFAEY